MKLPGGGFGSVTLPLKGSVLNTAGTAFALLTPTAE
jgi:hypothetical protein